MIEVKPVLAVSPLTTRVRVRGTAQFRLKSNAFVVASDDFFAEDRGLQAVVANRKTLAHVGVQLLDTRQI